MKPGRRDPLEVVQLQLAELTTRIRAYFGVRGGLSPHLDQVVHAYVQLANLDDPAYADTPRYFIAAAGQGASPGNNSAIVVQGGAKRTIVDLLLITAATAGVVTVFWNRGPPSGTQVTTRNVGSRPATVAEGRASIVTTTSAALPGGNARQVGRFNTVAFALITFPIAFRLGPPATDLTRETIEVWNSTVNGQIDVTVLGREWDE